MAILGLVSTESVSAQRWTNIRRKVFYQYPNGSAPLIGILSMMKEEETNDSEFSWWEKRLIEQVALTVAMNAGGCFGKTAAAYTTDLNGSSDTLAFSATSPVTYGLAVADQSLFRPGHIIKIESVSLAASKVAHVIGRVVTTSATGNGNSGPFLTFTVVGLQNITDNTMPASVIPLNTAPNVGLTVRVVGSAFPQGVIDLSKEVYYLPINPGNYTQIFRTPFSFTGSALVTPVKFDDTGVYKDKAKSHSVDHMVEMELGFLFGHKAKQVPTGTADPTTGVGLPLYYTGGLLWFLQQYEMQYSIWRGGDGASVGPAAVTADSSDDKRIIANASGTINEATYDGYLERIFRTTSNVSNEKLVLCGSGFLKVMNQMYRSQSTFVYNPPSGDTYGMELVCHKTAFGSVYYKTHPLFSRNAALRNNALFMDVHNMRYRNMSQRDTQLLKNRQPRDADYRKDEWFSEAGLELRMPETFMYLQNVTSYVP